VLLDAAALAATYRRAGRVPVRGLTPIEAAAGEDRPPVRDAAAARLAMMLAGVQAPILGEWLRAVEARGWGVPPEFLPTLADLARGRPAYRWLVAAAAGRRARWLADLNPDWHFLADCVVADSNDTWSHGSPAQRRSWLVRARQCDPAAAREALAAVWSSEPAVVRAEFLKVLEESLSPEDEEFCEAALDDRAADVRRLAAGLLARIPGSRYAARMTERVRRHLTVDRPGRLAITLPRRYSEAMRRDGIVEKARQGTGARAWWLRQILGAAPLAAYEELAGTPAELLRLEVSGVDAGLLQAALAEAAVRERSADWARALLTTNPAGRATQLVAVLPPDEWARAVLATGEPGAGLAEVVGGLPVPWPRSLGTAMLDLLAKASPDHRWARLASITSQAVPAEVLDHPITLRPPDEEQTWRRRLVETLIFRREMYEELS